MVRLISELTTTVYRFGYDLVALSRVYQVYVGCPFQRMVVFKGIAYAE